MAEPATQDLSAKEGEIEVFTFSTPNGRKITVLLEELGVPYKATIIDLGKGEQKSEGFLKINPNGRIPAIIDHGNGEFALFESGAILIYLAEKYGKFLPTDQKKRAETIQWLMFQMSGIGPMMGQANVWFRYWPEKIQPAIDRYQKESARLFGVLDGQLKNNTYLVGEEITIADFATYPWVKIHEWPGIDIKPFPNLERWLKTIGERPATQRGMNIPKDTRTISDEERAKASRTLVTGLEEKK